MALTRLPKATTNFKNEFPSTSSIPTYQLPDNFGIFLKRRLPFALFASRNRVSQVFSSMVMHSMVIYGYGTGSLRRKINVVYCAQCEVLPGRGDPSGVGAAGEGGGKGGLRQAHPCSSPTPAPPHRQAFTNSLL
jgi:hypothetical protein